VTCAAIERLAALGYRPFLRGGKLYLDPPGAPEAVRAVAVAHRQELLDALLFVPSDSELQALPTDRLQQLAGDLFDFMWRGEDEDRWRFRQDHERLATELRRRGDGSANQRTEEEGKHNA
jgi:hypothetical protein